ncbi:unnamed protein product [Effrenium voratum]|nr:unnamed protein product [Effrenium voratum]
MAEEESSEWSPEVASASLYETSLALVGWPCWTWGFLAPELTPGRTSSATQPQRVLSRLQAQGDARLESNVAVKGLGRAAGNGFSLNSRRSWMLGVGALLALTLGRPARAADEVDVYFGSGNFFRMQHEFVMKEALELGRREGDITSLAGYAGGKKAGPLERLCYNGLLGAPDHVSLGHAQVVRVTVPSAKLPDFTKTFLAQLPERQKATQGPQYRAAIGLRGGMDSKYFPLIQEVCEGKVKLVNGEGNEPDTFDTDVVYV